jgi:mono/diheme cytochrome c family protein
MRTLRLLFAAALVLGAARAQAQEAVSGELTFRVVCAACHTLTPPYEKAPPMVNISRHYREAFTSEAEGVEAIVQWVLNPDAARSKMPAHAIERFGVMPAFPLPEAQLRDVAKYVWALGAPAATPAPAAPAANAQQHQHNPPR